MIYYTIQIKTKKQHFH